jgi:hypothetical protein
VTRWTYFVTEARAFDPLEDWACTVAHDAPTRVAKDGDGHHVQHARQWQLR